MNTIKNYKYFCRRVPKIKFTGKRDLAEENQAKPAQISNNTSKMMKKSDVEAQNKIHQELLKTREESISSIRNMWKYRIQLSDKEVDEYNNGIQVKDWTKIQVFQKPKH